MTARAPELRRRGESALAEAKELHLIFAEYIEEN